MLGFWIILAHLIGDYIIQNDWMALKKTEQWLPAIVHGITYTIPYLFITQSFWALFIICSTHIIIDRFRLAKHFIWFKNQLSSKTYRYSWSQGKVTGFSPDKPIWLSTILMIVIDNILHLIINTIAILYF